jgi:4,4'-diaponeurosporenoate glycosyltransferase
MLTGFLIATFLLCLIGASMFLRLREVPVLSGPVVHPVRLSIIIPARNEEDNLAVLLPSLATSSARPHEIIVVDDQSSDATAATANSHAARVIPGAALPEGWYGKPWACQQGADAATGDWLLFLDADTELPAGGLDRLLLLPSRGDAVYSICPWHRIERPYERLSAFFNTIMVLGINAFSWRGESAPDVGLFGQAMLLSRISYNKVGGHYPVRRQVLENFHLARHFAAVGISCRSYLGRGTIIMRMFPGGFRDLLAGWSKGFVSGADNTPRSAMILISMWLSGLIMAGIGLTLLPLATAWQSITILAIYLFGAAQCAYVFFRVGRFGWITSFLYIIPLAFYQIVFFRAIRLKKQKKTVAWKGRDVS